MRLNEILEEHTIKSISQKTKISEENLENLLASNFDSLKKIKTLGFISILEREYKADLKALREEALTFYSENREENGFTVALPVEEEKKGTSKLFIFVVLILLGYASWYFFTQFDKTHLSELIPFMDEQTIETEEKTKAITVEDLSIANVVVKDTNTNVVVVEAVEAVIVQETNQSSVTMAKEVNVSVEPVSQF